ncbi:MAG: threonine/serine dehydratase [Deltaproteobacteria bacterium]|nr:threonine/serine dehydratase [Deltaproteobacteria bacterium]
MLTIPTLKDVFLARRIVKKHLVRTPLVHYPGLGDLLGCEAFVKHENHQLLGAFKVRGGVNLIAQLSEEERRRGVIAASTGNHGQSVAYGARLFGTRATICVPEKANPVKVEAMRYLGAEILFHGRDFDEARQYAESLAEQRGYRYIHSGDEPLLIAGVGTYALEIVEDQPDVETIVVPIGGGSGASGCCIVAKSIDPRIWIIGVQAQKAPSAYLSWKEKRRVEARMETFAEGLATRTPFDLPQRILQDPDRGLDDFVLVSEDELRRAVITALEKTHNLAEAAGASPIAGALRLKDRISGQKVALVMSGGNLSLERMREIVRLSMSRDGAQPVRQG